MVSSRTMKHRKLFPASTTNQSIVCPDVCDSTCPYDCYPYSDTYAVPPPSPPPPLLPPLSTKHGQNISPYVIIIATLLGIAFLIICYYLVIVKNCAGWNRFRPRRRQHESTEEDFVDENRGPAIDHPIWYIRTVGLQPSVINSIAVFRFNKGDSLIEGTDCSICLNEFQDDEILRLLPKCNHAFHIPCIDTWLRSHTTCPVCRSGIVSNSVSTPVASNNLNYNSLSLLEIVHTDTRDTTNEDNQMQYTESTSDGGLSNNQARIDEVNENRTITDDEVEFPQVVIAVQGETSNMRVNFDEDAASWVIDYSDENNMVQDEIQQMRRSISADSLSVAKIRLAMVNLPKAEFEDSPVNRIGDAHKCDPAEHNSSKSKTSTINYDRANASLQTESVSMKRSSSYGSRSFFSRNSRSLNSILPL